MSHFQVDILCRGKTRSISIDVDNVADAVAHAYIALTAYVARNKLRDNSASVIIRDSRGSMLAEITLGITIGRRDDNVVVLDPCRGATHTCSH